MQPTAVTRRGRARDDCRLGQRPPEGPESAAIPASIPSEHRHEVSRAAVDGSVVSTSAVKRRCGEAWDRADTRSAQGPGADVDMRRRPSMQWMRDP